MLQVRDSKLRLLVYVVLESDVKFGFLYTKGKFCATADGPLVRDFSKEY